MEKEMTKKEIEVKRMRLTLECMRAELNLTDFLIEYPEGYCHPLLAKRMKLTQEKQWEEFQKMERSYKLLAKEAEYEKTSHS